jgi:hypothetical protein
VFQKNTPKSVVESCPLLCLCPPSTCLMGPPLLSDMNHFYHVERPRNCHWNDGAPLKANEPEPPQITLLEFSYTFLLPDWRRRLPALMWG